MNRRKFSFWAALFLTPFLVWLSSVSESQHRYQGARDLLQNWETRALEANRNLRERDLLLDRWTDLQPIAEDALVDLENELNPLLVQKRAVVTARELGIQVTVRQILNLEGTHPSWTLQAEADYESLVRLVDRLERGQLRARFQEVSLILPDENSNASVRLMGEFQVPALPPTPEEAGA